MPRPTCTPAVTMRPPPPPTLAALQPSPPPLTHVVQAGETLIGIAVRYGVSLEALQAANPGVQAEYLVVGAVLIIPQSAEEAGVASMNIPFSTPAPLELGRPACYLLPTHALDCFVSARNPGNVPLSRVAVRIVLVDSAGEPRVEGAAYAPLDVLWPGAAVPFRYLFAEAPADMTATVVQPLSAEMVSGTAPAVALEILETVADASGTSLTVSGRLRNPSDSSLAAVRLILTLYADDGAVVGWRREDPAALAGLAPGESRAFVITAISLTGPARRYEVLAEGE